MTKSKLKCIIFESKYYESMMQEREKALWSGYESEKFLLRE